MILLEEGETLTGSDKNVTLAGFQLTGKNFQKGGLAGTVGTDKTVAVAFRKFDVHIFKKRLFSNS
jgi:hypothetical protein